MNALEKFNLLFRLSLISHSIPAMCVLAQRSYNK